MCWWKSCSIARKSDAQSLLAALMASGRSKDLDRGKVFHLAAIRSGHHTDIRIATAVLVMYSKCGSVDDARSVFNTVISPKDVVFWNAMIFGYVENGQAAMAMELFHRFQQHGCRPSARTMVAAFMACVSLAEENDLLKKKKIRRVVDMYVKFGKVAAARSVFERMACRDTISWNAMIRGCVEHGQNEEAFEMFETMVAEGYCDANETTVLAVIKALSALAEEEEGRKVDGNVVKMASLARGAVVHKEVGNIWLNGNLVGNALMEFYAKCGSMVDCRRAFREIDRPDPVSWTTLILGHKDNEEFELALSYFETMESSGCPPNRKVLLAAILACSHLAETEKAADKDGKLARWKSLERGMALHAQAETNNFDRQVSVASSLVDMYSKCGSMLDARRVFDRVEHYDVVLWTALILGYAENNEAKIALELFEFMCAEGNRDKEQTTFVRDKLMFLEDKVSTVCELRVTNALIDTYAKCGRLEDACRVFEKMETRNVVSWTVIISRYAQSGQGAAALSFFLRMCNETSCQPDERAFAAALVACGTTVRPDLGRRIQKELYRKGFESQATIAACLVDFYGKCGDMTSGRYVFESTALSRNIGAWNALIMGYSHQGDADQAFATFRKLVDEDLRPTEATMVSLLTAFSHAGLVDQGKKCFEALQVAKHGVAPSFRHYSCMIDLLGRASHLSEAVKLLEEMPFKADEVSWMTVLAACAKWENGDIGKFAFQSLSALEAMV